MLYAELMSRYDTKSDIQRIQILFKVRKVLTKAQLELLKTYSFIDNVERKGLEYRFHYHIKADKKFKKLPLRSNYKKVLETIKKIKQEIGVGIYGQGYNSEYYIIQVRKK